MIAIIIDAMCLVINILASSLFLSPFAQTGPRSQLLIWWLFYIGQCGVSLGNVSMFESPSIISFSNSTIMSGSSRIVMTTYNEKSDKV